MLWNLRTCCINRLKPAAMITCWYWWTCVTNRLPRSLADIGEPVGTIIWPDHMLISVTLFNQGSAIIGCWYRWPCLINNLPWSNVDISGHVWPTSCHDQILISAPLRSIHRQKQSVSSWGKCDATTFVNNDSKFPKNITITERRFRHKFNSAVR